MWRDLGELERYAGGGVAGQLGTEFSVATVARVWMEVSDARLILGGVELVMMAEAGVVCTGGMADSSLRYCRKGHVG